MWPLSMAHFENTKLSPNTAVWRTESIAEFMADRDAMFESTQARREYPGAPRVAVRRRKPLLGAPLWKLLRKRRTARAFSRRPLPWSVLERLLDGAAGVTEEIEVPESAGLVQRLRAWPSAGALYPIETYAVLFEGARTGAYHYDPVASCLERLREGVSREEVGPHVVTIGAELEAPALLVLTAMPERTLAKYGERGYRYLWLDLGHLAQNLFLAAGALGLGACPIGGFYEERLRETLGIDRRETPVYLMAIGYVRR